MRILKTRYSDYFLGCSAKEVVELFDYFMLTGVPVNYSPSEYGLGSRDYEEIKLAMSFEQEKEDMIDLLPYECVVSLLPEEVAAANEFIKLYSP